MAQRTDAQITTASNVIRDETVAGANTKQRVRDVLVDLNDSKINNDKISTDGTFASTGNTTIPSTQAVKTYVDNSVVPSLFLGLYTSLVNLEAAHPTATSGNWAIVDPGSGTDAVKYLWDEDEGWVAGSSPAGTGLFADLTDDPRDNALLEEELEALEAADDEKADLAITVRSITGNHTLDATDATNFTSGKSMHIKGDGSGTLTIPLQATQAMPAGYNVMYSGFTAVVEGNVSITTNPSSGSLTSSSTTAKYYLIRNAADDWDVENGGASDATKLNITNSAVALTDAASIALTATKHTLTTANSRTFTISYTGDDITIELTLNATSATMTFPSGSLCISEGFASGDNALDLSGVSGDVYIISIKRIGSNFYVVSKNMNR